MVIDMKNEMVEESVVGVVSIFEILKNLTLIKKYAFEKNDERIYLCADYIEKELHKVMYGDFVFEKEWHKWLRMTNEITKMIEELEEEDKRLNQIIINLHDDITRYKQKIQKQHMIINIQWDIIACLMELKGVIEDDDWKWNY